METNQKNKTNENNNSQIISQSKKKLIKTKIQAILKGFGKNFKFAPIIYSLLQISILSIVALNLHDQLLDLNLIYAQIFWIIVCLVMISYYIVSCKDPGYVTYQFSQLTDNSLKTDQMGKQSGIISILKSANDLSQMDRGYKPKSVDIDSKSITISSQENPQNSSRKPKRVTKRASQFKKKKQGYENEQNDEKLTQNSENTQNKDNIQNNNNNLQIENQVVTLQNIENFTLSGQNTDKIPQQHQNSIIVSPKSKKNNENLDENSNEKPDQLESIRSPQSRIEVENSIMSEGIESNNHDKNNKIVLDFNPNEKDEDEPEFILNLEDYSKKSSNEKQKNNQINDQDSVVLNSAISNYMNSAIALQKGQINLSSGENLTPTKNNQKYQFKQDDKQSTNFAKLFTQQMTTQDTVNIQTKLSQYEQQVKQNIQLNVQSQLNTEQDQQVPVITRDKINLAEHYKKEIQQNELQQKQNLNQNQIKQQQKQLQAPYISSNLPTHSKMNDSGQLEDKHHNFNINFNFDCEKNIKKEQKIQINQPEEVYLEKRYCQKCQLDQPIRSKHCNECKKCIATHDHHCPWVGNCIGEKNRCPFWWFLFFQLLELCYPFVPFIQQTIANMKSNIGIIDNPIIGLVIILLLGFFIFMVGVLFLFHTYLAFNNLTTWENASWDKISYLQEFPEDEGSPFSEGYLNNLKFYCTWRIKSKPIKLWKVFKKNMSDK